MAGTLDGGLKTVKTIKERYGSDYYRNIGKVGGSKTNTKPKGFAYAKANGLTWHKEAGAKGGKISRKPKNG